MKSEGIVAGDVGGTKTNLAFYQTGGSPLHPLFQDTFQNKRFQSFKELLETFLTHHQIRPSRACFGVAGPVDQGRVAMTNLGWHLDGDALANCCTIGEVLLVNDLLAAAAGTALLPEDVLFPINKGTKKAGNVAVIAPGTGLGEAFLVAHGKSMLPCAGEGGHASFAPRNTLQEELLAWLRKRQDHVSVEQVCSGRGFNNLYDFMRTRNEEPQWLRDQLDSADDPVPILVEAAKANHQGEKACPIAEKTVKLFIDILADECANLALKTLARGGVYIGGGLPLHLLDFFDPDRFMAIFCRGVYKEMLADIPIHIILETDTPLIGAAFLALSDHP